MVVASIDGHVNVSKKEVNHEGEFTLGQNLESIEFSNLLFPQERF